MDKKEFEQTMARVISHLGNMLGQGVPLIKGMLAIAADQEKPVRPVLELIADSIRSGNDFGSACDTLNIFPEEAIDRFRHAEKSGVMDRELPIIGEDIAYEVYPLNLPENLDEMKTEIGNRRRKIQQITGQLIKEAVEVRASDVHLEPDDNGGRVRFRIDGVLKHRDVRFDHAEYKALVARFKEMSALDVGETQRPQDGRILVRNDAGKRLGIRVSACPFTKGEKVVLRFLDQSSFPESLESIRISDDKIRQLRSWISRAHGVIVVSGPTGSGKTTSLYLMIKELGQKENINVMTVEDPVEFVLPGIYQMQLRPAIGLTWNSALRSMMRQDPDVIGIGEITAPDTAELMIQVAQTGHLTLSQLHAGSAVASIKLLHDMDIPVHMLQETFIGVLS